MIRDMNFELIFTNRSRNTGTPVKLLLRQEYRFFHTFFYFVYVTVLNVHLF